jgi:hypothetical protein
MEVKVCSTCNIEKPITAFRPNRQRAHRCRKSCIACSTIIRIARVRGTTVEHLENLKSSQDNKCAICEIPAEEIKHTKFKYNPLVVDHCHTTGKVRGMLCPSCNHALGHFKDNVVAIAKAIDYLNKHCTN